MPDRSERADVFLVSHGFASSRAEAQAAIQAGRVEADGQKITKSAQKLREGMTVQYEPAHPYVSRGGVKLAAALDHFALSPEGRVCLDIGASTGGFTQVLLECARFDGGEGSTSASGDHRGCQLHQFEARFAAGTPSGHERCLGRALGEA